MKKVINQKENILNTKIKDIKHNGIIICTVQMKIIFPTYKTDTITKHTDTYTLTYKCKHTHRKMVYFSKEYIQRQ